ncbi:hypothetical protein TNCV_1166311 [Trichonephila clavipes]|uniref:Uncharacterized protein n=1 Tax=Trichonephila clavipes TaxID=2585209 RepID=A0A8X6T8J9_TRICX|nr:hypothetical protein TNCV_1166311 [Trichonephila clavipes]
MDDRKSLVKKKKQKLKRFIAVENPLPQRTLAEKLQLLWEGFFQLRTRDGRVKKLYSGYQFSICQRELISIEEALNIDITFRSVATAQSCDTGQGIKKCLCKKKLL